VIVTNANGCTATSSAITNTVNLLPTPTLTSSDADNTFCAGTSVTFTAGGGTSYNFRVAGGSVQSGTSTTYTTNSLTTGQIVDVIVTNANGCIATSSGITNTVRALPTPTLTSSDADNTFCTGTSVTFTGGGGTSYNFRVNSASVQSGASTTYTTSGLTSGQTVDVIVTNANGCTATSSAITNTVNPLPTPTLTSSDADNTFCAGTSVTFTAGGGTSYNFRVNSISIQNGASTTYTTSTLTTGQVVDVIVTNSNGCIATSSGITNTVRALPTPTLTSSDADNAFCTGTSVTFTAGGGTSYNFRVNSASVQSGASTTYATSGLTSGQTVDVIVTNANGCIATSSGITNTVNALPTPTLTSSDADNTFCAGTSVTFTAGGGTNYNFRAGGTSIQSGTSTTYTTSSLTSGQIVDVIITNANGCTAISTGISNIVNPVPVANAGSGGNECDLTFKFNATLSIGTGTWTKTSGPGTATFAPSENNPTATVTVSEYGTYTFTWTEVSGSCSSSSMITVNFYQQPVISAGAGGNNCGLEFYLNGSYNIGTGTWTKVNGPGTPVFNPDANTANASVAVSAYGTYTFKWTVVNAVCSNSATVTVTFIQQPAANAGSGGDICLNEFSLHAIATSGTGTWTKSLGPGNAVFTPSIHQPDAIVTVDQFGTYNFVWTVVNSTCNSSDIVTVVFHDLPSIKAGNDTVICLGENIHLHALGIGSFNWTPAETLSNPDISDPVSTPLVTTRYTVTLTDQFGCKDSDDIFIEIRNNPIADAGPDQTLEYLFEATLNASEPGIHETGVWSLISGSGEIFDTTYSKTSVTGLSLERNEFKWTVSNGVCPVISDTVLILVHDLVIPTLITPNMDGRNDYFVLRGIETLGKTELTIFNRLGARVFKNSNYNNDWNGLDSDGNQLSDDTYFFVIKSENGISRSGYIVIRR
jgi:gliding motility-associated-like protein